MHCMATFSRTLAVLLACIVAGPVLAAPGDGEGKSDLFNPLAGIAHGRSTWAQVIQRVLLNNETPKQAADWGQRQFEEIRRDNVRLLG